MYLLDYCENYLTLDEKNMSPVIYELCMRYVRCIATNREIKQLKEVFSIN